MKLISKLIGKNIKNLQDDILLSVFTYSCETWIDSDHIMAVKTAFLRMTVTIERIKDNRELRGIRCWQWKHNPWKGTDVEWIRNILR